MGSYVLHPFECQTVLGLRSPSLQLKHSKKAFSSSQGILEETCNYGMRQRGF
jgi:hypothetical protein